MKKLIEMDKVCIDFYSASSFFYLEIQYKLSYYFFPEC